ncbi:hypothetical protein ANO11243_038100 [Dothideomycetidae sp. 11243]|nr:hypothetical protein ANO11243_038100 [fungal sp. No.11243]
MDYQMWVIHPLGCSRNDAQCPEARGGIFYEGVSKSWQKVGVFDTAIENNLGLGDNAEFGFDFVSLGGYGQNILPITNVTIAEYAQTDFYLGLLGVNPKPTNWSSFSLSSPSYVSQLKAQNMIPSLSFGYTAGAIYRDGMINASLTLGGYDQSRFEPNDVQFTFAADNSRDTVVSIQSITTTENGSNDVVQMLPGPIYSLVDATVAEIWLPIEACRIFEQQFDLIWDNRTDLYLVNQSSHSALLDRNAVVSFTIGQQPTGGPSVVIDLPYNAFDLYAMPPYAGLVNGSSYFPLRRAANSSQYTLGRTFMQEAYISVDYERAVFNLSRAAWPAEFMMPPKQIVTITPASNSTLPKTVEPSPSPTNGMGLGPGTIAGLAVGLVAAVALIILGPLLWRRRRMAAAKGSNGKSGGDDTTENTMTGAASIYGHGAKSELDAASSIAHTPTTMTPVSPDWPQGTLPTSPLDVVGIWAGEADGKAIHELPGSFPELNLADGRQITEKDMMRHRERLYNGIDSVEERRTTERERSTRRVQSTEPQRREPVDPDQIREATEAEGGNKRFSFVEGQDNI